MSVRLRLTRMGRKKRPFYRIVAADSRSPRDGKYLDVIGTYNPLTDPAEVKIDKETAIKWLQNGAQPTDTVMSLLRAQGILFEFELIRRGLTPEQREAEYRKREAAMAEEMRKREALMAQKAREEEKKGASKAKEAAAPSSEPSPSVES